MKLTEKSFSVNRATSNRQFLFSGLAWPAFLLVASLSSTAREYQWFPQGDGTSFSDPGNWYDLGADADPHNPSGPPGAGDIADLSSSANVKADGGSVNQLNGLGTATLTLNGAFSAATVAGGGMTLAGSGQLSAQTVTSFLTIVGGHLVAANYPARSLSVGAGGSLVIKSGVQSPGAPESFLIFADGGATLDVAGAASDVDGSIQGGAQATLVSLANLNTSQATLSVAGSGSSLRILGAGQVRNGSLDVSGGAKVTIGGSLSFEGASSSGASTIAGSMWRGAGTQISVEGGLAIGAGAGTYSVQLRDAAKITSPAGVVLGSTSGAEGDLNLDNASDVELGSSSMIVGQNGRGVLSMDTDSQLLADKLVVGRSQFGNRMTVGQNAILGVLNEMVVGEGGRGSLLLQRGALAVVKRLVVGRASLADNQVTVEGAGTSLSGSGRIDIGELGGRGTFEIKNAAEAKPAGGLSVGFYDNSVGTLSVHHVAQIITPGTANFGGGEASQATVTIWNGGNLAAYDILIFARPSGTSTVEVKAGSTDLGATLMQAFNEIDIGFAHDSAGPTLLRVSNGAFLSAGTAILVGNNGTLDATGGKVKVGADDFPPLGTVRVGPMGTLKGSSRVQGTIEVLSGGVVAPGSSPGTLTIQGNYNQKPGARLEIEVAGTVVDTGYDRLHVTGAATIPGATVAIKFIDGFSPRSGQTFAFFQADGGISGSFTNVQITGVAPGFAYSLVTNGSGGLSLKAENDGTATSAPRLDIARNGAAVIVSWPAPGNWILESSSGLPTGWLPVGAAPSRAGDRFSVTLPATQPAAFFRLRR